MNLKIKIPTAQQLQTDRQLADAQTAARHAAEDTRKMDAETDAVLETIAYGLMILICVLLAVLALTPAQLR